MKKKKKLNAEAMKISQRVSALEDKVEATSKAKNILAEKLEEALTEIDAGTERIGRQKLRCERKPKE